MPLIDLKFDGVCRRCEEQVLAGQRAMYHPGERSIVCESCLTVRLPDARRPANESRTSRYHLADLQVGKHPRRRRSRRQRDAQKAREEASRNG